MRDLRARATARPASTSCSSRPGACSRRARRRARDRTARRSCENYGAAGRSCSRAATTRARIAAPTAVPRRGRGGAVGRGVAARRRRRSQLHRAASLQLTPFALERRMLLARGRHADPRRARREHVGGGRPLRLGPPPRRSGAPLLAAGCRLEARRADDRDAPEMWEADGPARARASASRGRTRGCAAAARVDLARVPGPEAGSHDDVFLTDLDEGRLRRREPGARPARSGCAGTARSSVGGVLAALRRRAGDAARAARTRSAWSRGSRSGNPPRRGWPPGRRSSSPGGASLETTLNGFDEKKKVSQRMTARAARARARNRRLRRLRRLRSLHRHLAHGLRSRRDLGAESIRGRTARRRPGGRLPSSRS